MISCYFSQYFSQILRLFPFLISAGWTGWCPPPEDDSLGASHPWPAPWKNDVQTITVHKRGKQKQSSLFSNATHHFPADTFFVRKGIALFCLTPISFPVHCCAQLHQEFNVLERRTRLLSVNTCTVTPKYVNFAPAEAFVEPVAFLSRSTCSYHLKIQSNEKQHCWSTQKHHPNPLVFKHLISVCLHWLFNFSHLSNEVRLISRRASSLHWLFSSSNAGRKNKRLPLK